MNFIKWVKSIQTAGYNDARTSLDQKGHIGIFINCNKYGFCFVNYTYCKLNFEQCEYKLILGVVSLDMAMLLIRCHSLNQARRKKTIWTLEGWGSSK